MTYATILAVLLKFGAPDTTAPPVANGVLKYAESKQEAAFLISWSKHESAYSEAIAAGRCERWQCDARKRKDGTVEHLARGLFQLHRGAAGQDWDALPGDIDAQTRSAARVARWALHECRGDALCAFRLLGATHGKELKGEQARVRDYEAALRML